MSNKAEKGAKGFQAKDVEKVGDLLQVDPEITKLRKQKFIQALAHAQGIRKDSWENMRKQQDDFVNYFLPTDDQGSSSGSGTDTNGSWAQYEYLAERRIGLGPKITQMVAEDAVREGFRIMNQKDKRMVERADIDTWIIDTDFYNELARVIYFERVYGVGFLLAYYTKDDKKNGLLEKEIKKGQVPLAFEALSPTQLSPMNANEFESDKLDKDPQKWDLFGSNGGYKIHHSRVRVFMSRPVINRWHGLSIFERIWDSIIAYYQALIFLLRGFSKWGNLIPIVTIDKDEDLEDIFDDNVDLIEEMKMNGTFLFPRGTTIDFTNTQLAAGLREPMEIWLEDISAGTGIPVPILMGRVVASGLSGVGYIVAERYHWNVIKKVQLAFNDDVMAILNHAGFGLKEKKQETYWNLAITKTDQQRLMDEGMEIQNQILEEQLNSVKLDNLMKVEEIKMVQSGIVPGQQEGGNGDNKPKPTPKKTDFMLNSIIESIFRDRRKWFKMLYGGDKDT